MKLASSLYKGGELIDASQADYEFSRELGMVCPFCRESVFLGREYVRKNSTAVRASWRHYKASERSTFCEERALSAQGKEILRQLQPEARGQRLKLFNRRFWDIYRYETEVPHSLDRTVRQLFDDKTTNRMVKHCRDKWDALAIVKTIPSLLGEIEQSFPDGVNVESYVGAKISVLRHKILSEVIEWLPTGTASDSFRKVIQLAIIDYCRNNAPPIVHSGAIANTAVARLALTDWEAAIANLKEPLKGLGFAKT